MKVSQNVIAPLLPEFSIYDILLNEYKRGALISQLTHVLTNPAFVNLVCDGPYCFAGVHIKKSHSISAFSHQGDLS